MALSFSYGRIRQDRMGTKAENRRFVAEKLLKQSESANDFHSELVTLMRAYQPMLGVGPGVESELVDIAKEEVLGVVPDGSATLEDNLPAGFGEKKAQGWAVRAHLGESCKDISLSAHTDVQTVQQSVDLATAYIGLEGGEIGTEAD